VCFAVKKLLTAEIAEKCRRGRRDWLGDDTLSPRLTSAASGRYIPHAAVLFFEMHFGLRAFAARRRQGSGCKSRAAAQL
jgi:hypothetical protein